MVLYKKKARSMRRRPYRKPRFRSSMAKLYRMVRARRPETKYYADQTVSVATAAAGTLTLLTPMAQGAADGQRVGLWCKVKSIYLNYFITPAVGSANNITRVICFQWMDDYLSPPALNSILNNTSGGANAYPNSGYSFVYKDKYRVLYDRCHATGATVASNSLPLGRIRVRPKRATKWVDDVGTHHERGAVYMLVVGSVTGAAPVIDLVWKVSYTDN